MKTSKVILATDKKYSSDYEYVLEELYKRKIELFCAWGKYCADWETAMDLYLTDQVRMDSEHHITTTSHVDEQFEDVLNMATLWVTNNGNNEVETIKL